MAAVNSNPTSPRTTFNERSRITVASCLMTWPERRRKQRNLRGGRKLKSTRPQKLLYRQNAILKMCSRSRHLPAWFTFPMVVFVRTVHISLDAPEVPMANAPIPTYTNEDKRSARMALVEQHVRLENAHDLEGVLHTFGSTARYDDEAWNERYIGADGARQFYQQLMKALPDLEIDIQRRHVTDDVIVLEVMIRGTQLGEWRGLPPTGRRVEIPLCGVYTFDSGDRLAGEKIYYDRGTVLRQLGVFHEPQTLLGLACTFAT